jgi:DNA-binding MarR family transcriptional regulator
MAARAHLATLLSQALVAFTIEFDNEAEHRMSHRTTEFGATPDALHAPWLVSMAMYFNCLRYVGEQGIRLKEMIRLARTGTNLNGMRRWGYVYYAPDPADPRPKPPQADWMVFARRGGRQLRAVFEPLLPEIEARWGERFGTAKLRHLRSALAQIAVRLEPGLPDCLPIVGYGLFSTGTQAADGEKRKKPEPPPPESAEEIAALPLPALLARLLVALGAEFERSSTVSLGLSANVLRVLDERPIALRDLPELTGISKPYVEVSTGWLARKGYATLGTAPAPDKGKQMRLTEKGLIAQEQYGKTLQAIAKRWTAQFGNDAMSALRASLEPIAGDGTAESSPLFQGLTPYPEGWRGKVRKPALLPHYPLVTHRGGYPDGS